MGIDNSLESNVFILGDVENIARSWMLVKTSIDEVNSLRISGLYITSHLMWSKTAPHLRRARSCFLMRARVVWGRTAMRQSALPHSMIPKHSLCYFFPCSQGSAESNPPRCPCVLVAQCTWSCCNRQLRGKWNRAQRIHLANHPIFRQVFRPSRAEQLWKYWKVREVW